MPIVLGGALPHTADVMVTLKDAKGKIVATFLTTPGPEAITVLNKTVSVRSISILPAAH